MDRVLPHDDTPYVKAVDDLRYLHSHGALAGIAEIARERRRQVEQKGYTPAHDDQHTDLELITEASNRLAIWTRQQAAGTAGYPEAEQALRQCAALLAAEVDRLNRMMTGDGS